MRDLANLARDLVKALFDPYRPELHYMRGPGPKWRAKHEWTLQLGADVLALPALASAAKQSIRPRNLVAHAASLILGIALFVIALCSPYRQYPRPTHRVARKSRILPPRASVGRRRARAAWTRPRTRRDAEPTAFISTMR